MTDTTLAAVGLPRQRVALPLVRLARAVARTAHIGQHDLAGGDLATGVLARTAYYLRLCDAPVQAAGWLHQVLARTEYTTQTLRVAGIPGDVIDLVAAVTPRRHEDIGAQAARVGGYRDASLVLLASITSTLRHVGSVLTPEDWAAQHHTRMFLLTTEVTA